MANNISAFKLFYDEFIYKENKAVSYVNISENIAKIRELVIELRKTPKYNLQQYMEKLDRVYKRLKENLDNILVVNRNFFEFYLIIYKNHNVMSNDRVEDIPFVLLTSFYNDYRLDNKSADDLENSEYVIPKYSSLEKKDIRKEAKSVSKLEFFISLLKKSNNRYLYEKFLDKSVHILRIKPLINESNYDFYMRIDSILSEYERLWKRLEEKARNNEDYEVISEVMEIAYKRKFNDWDVDIRILINEYFEELYRSMRSNKEVRSMMSVVNEITFEHYKESCDQLNEEKNNLLKDFENNRYVPFIQDGKSYLLNFKNVLANSFFDKRFKSKLVLDDDVDAYVDRAIELYALADELDDEIFEKVMFDASHSPVLKRGNDVHTALITHIYELYNPLYLLGIYEETKKEFDELLNKKSIEFKREFDLELIRKKDEYDYHGPIPSKESIRLKIVERRKKFILDNCITELFSRDILGNYDTRNYDLSIIAKDISVEDMVNLYYLMKNKIEDFNFESMNFINRGLVDKDYDKNITLKTAQEFAVKAIFNKLKNKAKNDEELNNAYKDICSNYLKEDILFLDVVTTEEDNGRDEFEKTRKEYSKNTNWNKLIKDNKIKISIK